MRYECIADIYSANEKIREGFIAIVSTISPDEAAVLPDGEKWTIQQIAEHVSIVESGISRICAKLLESARADGNPSDGSFSLSENFGTRAGEIAQMKVEAPERVHPAGDVSMAESLERLESSSISLKALSRDLNHFDFSEHTFPHPFFGPLTAGEWLVMAGLHENRHRQQIERILEKIRQ